jgi:hypothetical protein
MRVDRTRGKAGEKRNGWCLEGLGDGRTGKRAKSVGVVEVVDGSGIYRRGGREANPKVGPAVLVSEVVQNFKWERIGWELRSGRIDEGGERRWSRNVLRMRR